MSQESSTQTNTTSSAKPRKRWLTVVLLLILIGVGLFGIDKAVEGKFFKAVRDTAATTIGGGMNEQQKGNVDKFQKRLTELRSQREAIAKGEVNVAPATESASPDSKPADAKPVDAEPASSPPAETPESQPTENQSSDAQPQPAGDDKPADVPAEKKDGE